MTIGLRIDPEDQMADPGSPGAPTADPLGTRVGFSGCRPGDSRGVASLVVATSGADNGKVVAATRCPGAALAS